MDHKEELQDLNLDDILSEFRDQPQEEEGVDLGEELRQLLEELPSVETLQAAAEQAAHDAEEAEKALDIEELVNRCEINHQRLRLFPKK